MIVRKVDGYYHQGVVNNANLTFHLINIQVYVDVKSNLPNKF